MSSEARNKLRAKIFDSENTKPKSKFCQFFGVEVEVRQPPLSAVLAVREDTESSMTEKTVSMILRYTYVPNTDEKVFEEADRDQLSALPFGSDFTRLSQAIASLTDLNLLEAAAEKN